MSKPQFKFCTPENVEALFNNTQSLSKKYFSKLFTDLKVHDVHKESCGYWSSTKEVLKNTAIQYELPSVENALVVPYYLSDYKIAHIRLIMPKTSGGYDTLGLGPSPNGWFNLLNSSRVYETTYANDKEFRLPVFDSVLSALTRDYGVHAVAVNDQNLKALLTFSRRLSLSGHSDFLKKWANIEGFDITVNKTSMTIGEYSAKNFCFEELLGLDMRAVIPAAINYMSNMPVYERQMFNREFSEIFKLDLRTVAPYLFEHTLAEKKVVQNVRDALCLDFKLDSFTRNPDSTCLTLEHRPTAVKHIVQLSPSGLVEFFSLFYGDLIDFCYSKSIGGLPVSYTWDEDKKTRLPRVDTFDKVSKLFYMSILGLLKGKFDAEN